MLCPDSTHTESGAAAISSSPYEVVIFAGTGKDGQSESVSRLEITAGESLAVVGPTGSGKSELLSDIEQLARGDTLSGRKILFKDRTASTPTTDRSGLVAQLTQKTGFVMDCDVTTFLTLHAQCRGQNRAHSLDGKKIETIVEQVLSAANRLCGEPISADSSLQILSGGQARALMIADIAHISDAPIVLIDEIENAGIDKMAAMDVLSSSSKLIVISTHDPVLTLMASRRLVMKNGAMDQVKSTSFLEKNSLLRLRKVDGLMAKTRDLLRAGLTIHPEVLK
jgi:ABC-type lipoprotein export system ATPase subunit